MVTRKCITLPLYAAGLHTVFLWYILYLTIVFLCPRPGGIKRWWCLASVCRIHRAYVENGEVWEDWNWHRGNPRHTWLGQHFQGQKSKVKVNRPLWLAVLAGQHGLRVRPSDGSICVYEVYRVTTCRPGRGHIVAASRLQLVYNTKYSRNVFQIQNTSVYFK